MKVTILRDGVPVSHVSCPSDQLAANIPEGCSYVEEELPLPRVADDHAALIRNAAKVAIEMLERRQARALREYLLGDTGSLERLRAIDNEIAALRHDINNT